MAKKKTTVTEATEVATPNPAPSAALDVGAPILWRNLTTELLGSYGYGVGEDGDMSERQRNECAAMIEDAAKAIAQQFPILSRKCSQNDSATVKAGMSLAMDRSGGSITKVQVHLSASEKWVDAKLSTDVCDPEQELGLYAEGAEAAAAEASGGTESADPESETATE